MSENIAWLLKLLNWEPKTVFNSITIISLEITFIQVSFHSLSKSGRSALGLRSPLRFDLLIPVLLIVVMFRSSSLFTSVLYLLSTYTLAHLEQYLSISLAPSPASNNAVHWALPPQKIQKYSFSAFSILIKVPFLFFIIVEELFAIM